MSAMWGGLVLWLASMAVLAIVVWRLSGWWFRRKRPRVSLPSPKIHYSPQPTGSERVTGLRQNLLRKVSWDEAVMERLIEFERGKLPNAPLHTLFESAIERWERDNR